MKKVQFDLEKAKAGAKIVTRDGRPARIICWDRLGTIYNILALVKEDEREETFSYTNDGRFHSEVDASHHDLFIIEESAIRPYNNAEEVLKDMKEHGPMVRNNVSCEYCAIKNVSSRDIIIDSYGFAFTFEKFQETFTWQDGHPCGVCEEDTDE